MQNRYFGDVGDFGKYGLLRKICGPDKFGPGFSLGVVWYLVPDEEHNDDGRHISYLNKPDYRACDPELFDTLKNMLRDEKREVAKIQNSRLLPEGTLFAPHLLSYEGIAERKKRLSHRDKWLRRAIEATNERQVIFLDPDNGFQVKSVPKHTPKAPKYVFWDEVQEFAKRKKTLIVYHHLNRTMKAMEQIQIKLKEIGEKLPTAKTIIPVLFRRGSLRVFYLIPGEAHQNLISKRLEKMLNGPWSAHMELPS